MKFIINNKARMLLAVLSTVSLVHCGQKAFDPTHLSSKITTGHKAPNGEDYVVGNEDRIVLEKQLIAPVNPELPSSEESRQLKFNQSLKDFVFLRYEKGSEKPARLGEERFTLQVLFNSRWISFSGPLKVEGAKKDLGSMSSAEDTSVTLSGNFEDFEDKVVGTFKFSQGDVSATILYRAYRGELKVNAPSSKNLNEHQNLKRKLDLLQSSSFAWVNTFAIPFGTSIYDIALVHQTSPTEPTVNPLQFRGESVSTGNLGDVQVNLHENFTDQDLESISLIGNAEGEDSKIFAVKMKDDKGETTEVMVDIERKKSEEELLAEKKREEELITELYDPVFDDPEDKASDEKAEQNAAPVAPNPNPEVTKPEVIKSEKDNDDSAFTYDIPLDEVPVPVRRPEPSPSVTAKQPSVTAKQPARTGNGPSQSSLGNSSKSYLTVSSGSNALKIVRDFDSNFALAGVQKEIRAIKNSRAEINKLKAFFKYANPFRGLIEKIAAGYSVPPQYAYVTVIESAYFTGGKYVIQPGPGSTAVGPFQILLGTAKGLGMRVLNHAKSTLPGASDERRFFAPSACAAAKYFRNNAKLFPKDTTLTILAYNQGEGRALSLAKNYGNSYSYAKIAKNNVKGVSYSNKKLAAYFIAGVYEGSSFDVDSSSPKQLPNRTIFPSQSIKDQTCASLF